MDIFKELSKLNFDNKKAFITGTLSRKDYVKLNAALSLFGGKWNKKEKYHMFPCNIKPLIEEAIKMKQLPPKNPTAFFPTPKKEIKLMLNFADLVFDDVIYPNESRNIRVLEPSAGQGAIALELKKAFPNAMIDTVEFLEVNQKILKNLDFNPYCQDFLDYNKDLKVKYNYIFMNPPFSYKNHNYAYIEHIFHAYEQLADYGTLVAIAPSSFIRNTTKLEQEFYNFASSSLCLEVIERGAFLESGTNVETVIFKISKSTQSKEFSNGYINYTSYLFFLQAMNDNKINNKIIQEFEKASKSGFFNEKTLEILFSDFIEELKKEKVFFPFNEMANYLIDAKRLFLMDYDFKPQPKEVFKKDVYSLDVIPAEKRKVKKIQRPTLF